MKKSIYIALLSFTSLLYIACNSTNKEADTQNTSSEEEFFVASKRQFDYANMRLGSLETHNFTAKVQAHGKTQVPPSDRASLMAYAGAYIKAVHKQRGEEVKKGEAIVSIENPKFIELQKDFIAKHKALSALDLEMKRQTALYEEKISSKKSFEQTEVAYQNSLIELQSLEKELQVYGFSKQQVLAGNLSTVASLRAPISGVIEKLDVHLGQYISSEEEVAIILDVSRVHLDLDIFEKDWPSLEIGQEVKFNLASYEGKTHSAEIEFIGKSIDLVKRTVPVQAKITSDVEAILPGVFVEASIDLSENQAMALAETSFVNYEGDFYILKLESEDDENYYFSPLKIDILQENATHKSIKNPELYKDVKFLTNGAFMVADFD